MWGEFVHLQHPQQTLTLLPREGGRYSSSQLGRSGYKFLQSSYLPITQTIYSIDIIIYTDIMAEICFTSVTHKVERFPLLKGHENWGILCTQQQWVVICTEWSYIQMSWCTGTTDCIKKMGLWWSLTRTHNFFTLLYKIHSYS